MVKKIISFRQAVNLGTLILSLLSLFHLVIILGIYFFDFVPIEFLWGGKMETRSELLQFEIISLLVSVFCVFIVLVRSGAIKISGLLGFSRVVLWLLFVLFIFNTLGNLIAETIFERVFALVTIVLAISCLRMALEPINNAKGETN
jgi:hypothetical protein